LRLHMTRIRRPATEENRNGTGEAYDENGHPDKPLGHGYRPSNRCAQAASSDAALPGLKPRPIYPMDTEFVLDPAYVSRRQFCLYADPV